MNRSEELEGVLAELRQQHRDTEAPAHILIRLCAATDSQQPRLKMPRWVLSLAAALVISIVGWRVNRSTPAIRQQARQVPPTAVAPFLRPAQPIKSATVVKRTSGVRRAAMRAPARGSELVTAFVALPGSEGLPPPMETSVLRVQLRKGDLRQYGFDVAPPLAAELVRADFVVGDDGLARAVRFVR